MTLYQALAALTILLVPIALAGGWLGGMAIATAVKRYRSRSRHRRRSIPLYGCGVDELGHS